MRTSPDNIKPRARGFTLVELLIVVGVIMVLIGIMLPALGRMHDAGRKAQTMSTLGALQTGLQAYFADFNMYPPSSGGGQGSIMLAQGLMGYKGFDVDGAGPKNNDGNTSLSPNDPQFGFRATKAGAGMSAMGVLPPVKGPYASPDPKSFKSLPVSGTALPNYYFVDGWSEAMGNSANPTWNHEILYFRSTRAPGAAMAGSTQLPTNIFETGTVDHYFDTADCSGEKDLTTSAAIPSPRTTAPTPAFFGQIGASSNTSFTSVTGASSYLLISAGPDGKYFTSDDFILSK